jgi:hypothetical protein
MAVRQWVKRDRQRSQAGVTQSLYKEAIHEPPPSE